MVRLLGSPVSIFKWWLGMRTRFNLPFLAAVLVAAGCSEPSAPVKEIPGGISAIVNGTPTGSSFGNVGALLVDFDSSGTLNGDDLFCSGSLVAPDVFLTAAHCVVTSYTPPGTQFYVSFASDLYSGSINAIAADSVRYDPLFGMSMANLHDLALVFLPAGSTSGITPLQLPSANYLTGRAAKNGLKNQVFVNVGYGSSADRHGKASFPYDGTRQWSQSVFSNLDNNWLLLSINTKATGLGGDCYGDSGSPKFLDGNYTTIMATVTSGDANCRSTSKDWRLDTPEARGFLSQYLTLP